MTFIRNLLSAFNLGHASFVGSSALMQLFPLLSAPIIARLYTPAEFGIYAVGTGRICLAALNTRNIDYVADAIAAVL